MNHGESAAPSEIIATRSAHALAADETFRLPSTTLFLGLMPVFSGLARRADLAAVLTENACDPSPTSALSVAQGHALALGSADGENAENRPSQIRTYIVYSGRESQARTSLSLFEDDPLWSEGELSALIKRQFGPTGLKHLLGVMIAVEEHASMPDAQPGAFVFDASRHLDILGYSRSNRVMGKGYHSAKRLREARAIVSLLCSLTIVQEIRLGDRRGSTLKIRLLQDEASVESWENIVADGHALKERITTNEKIFLRFNPHLFNAAVDGSERTRQLYTLQLKKLSRENARSQSLTLILGVHLPIKFRLNHCQPLNLSARAFLRMAGIVEDEYTRYEHLERLENTLRHMVEQGYISRFETERYIYTGTDPNAPEPTRRDERTHFLDRKPAPQVANKGRKGSHFKAHLELKGTDYIRPQELPEPLEEMWRVDPPEFLQQLLQTSPVSVSKPQPSPQTSALPRARPTPPLLPGVDLTGAPPDAGQLLRQVRNSLNLQQAELARRLNVTQAAVSMAESGKRPRMAERLLQAARRLPP